MHQTDRAVFEFSLLPTVAPLRLQIVRLPAVSCRRRDGVQKGGLTSRSETAATDSRAECQSDRLVATVVVGFSLVLIPTQSISQTGWWRL